ncbi:SMI1/KNR4 family protein [Streptomyces sp. RFCAC02]|uniref:SMI1/KNR4 family protein n=1 Tax=Streptomyces sp. RFCAC02 TaxID=2499143 RepID=UPI0019CF7F69|nr:SMI1/KNR4 family protein [Streptomyces sp. RFCAC02]
MNDALTRLVRVAPPGQAPAGSDWSGVAASLAIEALPPDYTALADRYGGGHFDQYLCLLHPACEVPDYNLFTVARRQAEALPQLWAFEARPPQLEAPGTRAVPWAVTEDGEVLYWLVGPGRAPAEWTVLVNEGRGPYWEHHDVGCAEFLVSLLTGERRSEVLASDLPGEHRFDPLPTGAGGPSGG